MLKLDGIASFVAVAQAGSISAAARRLGVSKSVVSERLLDLERSLGARLVQRTTRKLSLTEDGVAFLDRGGRIMHDVEETATALAERRGKLVGSLRLSAPVSFGTLHLGPALYSFLTAHPGIDLTLDLDDRFVDVAADGFDAVIRHGPIRDSRLIARRIASSRRVLVASPDYLERHGRPRAISDLETHRAILYTNREGDWRFPAAGGATVVRPSKCMRVNNGLIMRDAAVAGLGLSLLPTFMIHAEITSGALEIVDLGVEAEGAEIHIAYLVNRGASAKLDKLTAHLRQTFGDPPPWDAGPRSQRSRRTSAKQ